MRRLFLLLACALPLAVAACGSDSPTSIEDTEFAPALGVDLSAMTRTSSGLYWRDITVGTGAVAQSGNTVGVYYQGWLATGTRFDGRTSGTPLSFPLGTGWAIRGWDQGVPGMKVGGKRQLVIPPSLGYGAAGQGSIPPNAILVFEVEMKSVS
ncbi:MAG TPA: FKBP-type peptidyl-prolyl cis-trans isomerase [Longimicrobium sp.]|nr:FKBP-type peptidyl-prolyl cis-trans isomerase [Longimicrobium sp.]